MVLTPGTRVGRYEILGPLGEGGMGQVYRASDPRLGRNVAVKVLQGEWAGDAEQLGRFEQEARATAALNHPHILSIFDIGTHEGAPYLVTELLEGETLGELLTNGPLGPAKTLEYAMQIASGLHAAHDRGILHRDLKPDNILICSADDRVKILDFGLAKIRQSRNEPSKTTAWRTAAGTVLGTFGYMAPEMVRGEPSDHRADLFAFGAVLYEMLTAKRAFGGRSNVEAIAAVLEHEVPDLSVTSPGVPPALAEIVRQCLEKDAARRIQATSELVRQLKAAADGRSRAALKSTQTKTYTPAAACVAVLPFIDMSPARDQGYLCEGIAEEITNTLSRARGLRVIARTSAFRFKDQARDVREIGSILGANSVLEGSIRSVGTRIRIAVQLVDASTGYQIWSDRFDRDLGDVLALQDDISRRVAESLSVRLAIGTAPGRTADVEAHALYLRGRHHWNKRTEHDLEHSLDYFRRALARDPAYAQAHAGMAESLITLGIYGVWAPADVVEAARSAANEALTLAPNLAGALGCLGCIEALHDRAGPASVRDFERAVALNPDEAGLRQWYGMNGLLPLGRFDEALRELRLALALDPLSLPISASIGIALYYAGRYSQAAAALTDTCQLDDGFALAHLFLGYVHDAEHRFDDAAREFDNAARGSDRSPEMLSALGFTLSRAGDMTQARSMLEKLRRMSTQRYVSPVLMAQLYAGLHDVPRALHELERANALRALDLVWIRTRHTFESLRGEPRFQAIAAIASH